MQMKKNYDPRMHSAEHINAGVALMRISSAKNQNVITISQNH
jgi:hypothetical protein